MLSKRSREEEGQTKLEMATFMEEVERDRRRLLQDVTELTGTKFTAIILITIMSTLY